MNTIELAKLDATANARVATCDIYINRRALVSHNCVVVSNIWNGRGAHQRETGGQLFDVIGPFPNQMPTCYTREDAEKLCAGLNEHLAGENSDERVRVISAREWWKVEREAALSVLDTISKL